MCACRLRLPAYALSALLPALLVAGAFAGARPAAAAATSAIAQVASVARPVIPRASGVRGFRASLRAPAPGRAANTFVWDVDAPRGVSARVMSVALSGCWGTAQVARAVARAASGSSVAVASRGGAVTVAGRHGAALTLPVTIGVAFKARLKGGMAGARMAIGTGSRRVAATVLTVGGPSCASRAASSSARASAPRRTGALAINSGGAAVAPFVADTDYHGGSPGATARAVSVAGVTNPAPRAVYQSERYGRTFSYVAPRLTPGAPYTVRLHFAEVHWVAAGKRVFDVAIDGARVLSHFDIYAAAGGSYRAVVRSFVANATSSGTITVAYMAIVDNAKSSAVEILPAPSATPTPAATRTSLAAGTATRMAAGTATAAVIGTAPPVATGTPTMGPAATSAPATTSTATAAPASSPTSTALPQPQATSTAVPAATSTATAGTATATRAPATLTSTATAGTATAASTSGPPTTTPSATTGAATAIPSAAPSSTAIDAATATATATATAITTAAPTATDVSPAATRTAVLATPSAISSDPFTPAVPGQHASEVEPDTFAYGDTVVSAFQVGRFDDGGSTAIGWATRRGGAWRHGLLPGVTGAGVPAGPYDRASDPSVAYDAAHGVWLVGSLAIMNTSSGAIGKGVVVNRSADGVDWTGSAAPYTATVSTTGPNFYDKDWVVCDNTAASPYYGHCYIEWDDASQNDKVLMSVSTDGGKTWGAPAVPSGAPSGLGGQPVARPDGTVVVPFESGDGAAIESFTSVDGGATWGDVTTVGATNDHRVAGGLRSEPLPSAEVDGAGTIYVAWQSCAFEANCVANPVSSTNDIVLSVSRDGTAWSPVARVPIDPVGSPVDHFIPGVGVDRATSGATARLGLTYYYYPNAKCDASTCQLEVGFVSSTNGGATWSAPRQLAGPMSLGWLPTTTLGPMVGDYISTSVAGAGAGATVAVPVFAVAGPPRNGALDEAMYSVQLDITGGALPATGAGSTTAAATGRATSGRREPPSRRAY